MRWQRLVLGSIASLFFIFPSLSLAISPGQTADFQDGTIQGWTNGGVQGPLPANIPTGGPAGAGDQYLEVSSGTIDGQPFPPKLITFNRTTFVGDYVAAGVSAIAMDLKNFSPIDNISGVVPSLPMRFALENGFGSPPAYISNPFMLNGDGAWHHVVFLMSAADLNPFSTTESLSQVLSTVSETRILAATSPALQGDSGNFRFGVDNIQAIERGDWNRDGNVTDADITAMLTALTDLPAYQSTENVDNKTLLAIGDLNMDGKVNNLDIQPLLDLLGAAGLGSVVTVPEPAAVVPAVWALATLGLVLHRRRLKPVA